MKNTIKYQEGDVFALPVKGGGAARGVIARLDRHGRVLGYFLGPRLRTAADAHVTRDLRPGNSILIRKFGDLGLLKREWWIIGRLIPWNREEWPLPPLRHKYDDTGDIVLRHYDEDTLNFSYEAKTSPEESNKFPNDGLSGYEAIEIRLGKLLK